MNQSSTLESSTLEPETFELNAQYSTTRCVTQTQPVIANKPEDKIHSVLFLADNPERKAEGGLRTQGYFKHHHADKPLISVITVVFNGAEHLEQTINSVIGQSYDNVEYIIIDGGSTDGTLEIIKKYEEQIDYWVSEPDKGIYDAMNKSAALATGRWINFMNTGDSFHDNEVITSIFDDVDLEGVAVVYGNTNHIYNNTDMAICKPKPLNFFFKGFPFCHQSSFVKTPLLKEHLFDQEYNINADYDFFYKLYVSKLSFRYIDRIIANYDMYGISSNYVKLFKEKKKSYRHMNQSKPHTTTKDTLLDLSQKNSFCRFCQKK